MMNVICGGIEGGSTGSRIVLLDAKGKQLGFAEGAHTNQWLLGMPEAVNRLLELIDKALENANLPAKTSLTNLGLALSGVDTEENEKQLIDALEKARPGLAKNVRICNDAIGTYMTAFDEAGIVLISGTGSICKYVRPDLSFVRVGGLGYSLGDGGSGYYIAHRTIIKYLEIHDGLIHWDHPLDVVQKIILDYFKIDNPLGLLYHFYEAFDKGNVARLCIELANAAREGDQLCKESFYLGGQQLGRHVRACLRHSLKALDPTVQQVPVLCCGNVFHNWDLLQSGFRDVFTESLPSIPWSGSLNIIWLQKSAAYGAARFAARLDQLNLPKLKGACKQLDHFQLREVD